MQRMFSTAASLCSLLLSASYCSTPLLTGSSFEPLPVTEAQPLPLSLTLRLRLYFSLAWRNLNDLLVKYSDRQFQTPLRNCLTASRYKQIDGMSSNAIENAQT